ncbi:glycosyltransferase family 4 protein [Glycomyces arizonensis]|uniref:glycosyltransferase family 4 protein n=1 Tax=Glycomyces arizonensis TaxID=256035 RepID=UPI00041448BE|nr:glycosyltransferase family 4 protein [Glycomyces arizonensis]
MNHSRKRIVMLVQNGVVGDSRVQKEAEWAAEAGWDVVLLGRAPKKRAEEWTLGKATVRLVPVVGVLDRRRHEVRGGRLRSPLAYPPGPLEAHRRRQRRVWKAEIDQLRARRAIEPSAALRLELFARRAHYAVVGAWVEARCERSRRLRERRKHASGRIDRLSARAWRALLGDRAWRRLDPSLWELELAFGPVIDKLKPDLIHANDFQMLGVGARAKVRALAAGRPCALVWDAHEFLQGMQSWKPHPWWLPAQQAHEREYAPRADAVVTVSEPLADLLVDAYALPERPAVVMNAPDVRDAWEPAPSLREHCGIDRRTPLMVYSGAPLEQRGMHLMVEALPSLPEAHAAFVVSKPSWRYVKRIQERAAELGVADRTHVLTYVPYRQIVPYLSEADVGVHPLRTGILNHEIALSNKFFEYAHARLPLVVSDVRTMAAAVRDFGHGEVFRSGDVEDFVRAAKAVLADPERYRAAYDGKVPLEEWTWGAQVAGLVALYRRCLGGPDD